jgi:hypothetical protein
VSDIDKCGTGNNLKLNFLHSVLKMTVHIFWRRMHFQMEKDTSDDLGIDRVAE